MARIKKAQKKAQLSQSLEPVKHLSPKLQHKLLNRVDKQSKQFRSSGEPYPLVTMQSSSVGTEENYMEFPLLYVLAQLD